jgi:hypothetical protein
MKKTIVLRSAVCAAALLTSTSAIADVTAAQVWADWQESLEIYGPGSTIIGSETVDGDTLTVSGLSMVVEDVSGSISSEMGPISFTENGDGSVSITVPESYILALNVDGGFVVDLEVLNDNMAITVTGEPDAMNYELSADSYTLRVADFKDHADDVEGEMFLKASNVTGSYQSGNGASEELSYSMLTENVDVLVDIKELGGDGYFLVSGKMEGLASDGKMAVPEGVDFDDPDTLFENGFEMSSTSGYLGADFLIDFDAGGEAGTASFQMGEGGFHGSIDASQLSYGFAFDGVTVNVQAPELPFPVKFSWDQAETEIHMPLASSEASEEFGFNFALTEVTVNDEIWAMADPAGAIPRDPISVELALSGLGKLFFDLLDPEQAQAIALADVPGELEALTLGNLRLSAAGAEILGSGDFTFDNTDLETFDGMPRPAGELNLNIKGANALIDTAVEMGLLPEEQAGLGRLFMGMFTTPTGDDELTSKIEINDEGHVMANGQRIQ